MHCSLTEKEESRELSSQISNTLVWGRSFNPHLVFWGFFGGASPWWGRQTNRKPVKLSHWAVGYHRTHMATSESFIATSYWWKAEYNDCAQRTACPGAGPRGSTKEKTGSLRALLCLWCDIGVWAGWQFQGWCNFSGGGSRPMGLCQKEMWMCIALSHRNLKDDCKIPCWK